MSSFACEIHVASVAVGIREEEEGLTDCGVVVLLVVEVAATDLEDDAFLF